ncbi:hypothetical protein D9757_008477 [Collybiopsis confluens]|uniref:HIT domain-containing protein n=1 Tax=Collybiopsis confluens TaxID=2823264 RepID=A0A8H5HG06_9AGAR|nr:hypothetical protein D9757_008477 [Collybiopsis confluens]
MTSFIIKDHVRRPKHTWNQDYCAFCRIIAGEAPSNPVYENDKVVAFLDIMPLRRGHTLVIPKVHYSRLSELPPEYAAAIGEAVSKVAHALTQALGNTALNVVCNQEYAQAVPHVHYHIIPAPTYDSTSTSSTSTLSPSPLTSPTTSSTSFLESPDTSPQLVPAQLSTSNQKTEPVSTNEHSHSHSHGPDHPMSKRQMHQMEFAGRSELEDEDALLLIKMIRARL